MVGIDRTINLWTSQFSPPIKSEKQSKKKNKKKKKHSPCSLKLCHSIIHEQKINVLKVAESLSPAVIATIGDKDSSKIFSDDAKSEVRGNEMISTEVGDRKVNQDDEEEEEEGGDGDEAEEDSEREPPPAHIRLGWQSSIVIVADVTNSITVYNPVDR